MTAIEAPGQLRWHAVSQVIIAFAGSGGSAALANVAAMAARVLGASVTGLYVRDIALQDLAGLPFAATLGVRTASPERLTPEAVERAWAREEARCRAALARSVEGTSWSFEAVEGRLDAVLRPRLARATLVAIAAADRADDAGLWGLARSISRTAGAVLVVPSAAAENGSGPVLAVDDGDPAGAETISLADRIAQVAGRPLAVLALGTPAESRAIAARARGIAGSTPAKTYAWPDWRAEEIGDPIARIAPSVIVGDFAGRPFADPAMATRVFRRLASPLLLISPENAAG